MNKIWLSASLLAIVTVIIAGVSYETTRNKTLSPNEETLETCKSLVYNGPDAINLLFFSSKRDAEVYSNYLLNRKPFDSHKDKFNVYYVDDYSPECTHYRSIALFCDSKELTLKSGSCPHDYTFVLKKDDASIRSSAYNLVGSINTAHPLSVLQHEFGHLFANFAEEYAPASLPAGQPNCKSKCLDFEEYSANCYSECSDSSHYRSIENGVMRTLSSDKYGEYNEKVISSIIEKLSSQSTSKTTGLVVIDNLNCQAQSQLIIEGHNSQEGLVIDSLTKAQGCAPKHNAGPGTTSIIQNGQVVSSYNTPNLNNIFTDGPPSTAEENTISGETYNSDSFSFSIPYSPGDTIETQDSNNNRYQASMSTIGATPCRIE